MKAHFTLVLLFICLTCLKAQITIGENDFANANDTDRVSNASIPNNLNYKATGADTVWDYSFLQWTSQQVDKMLNPLNTNAVYAVYYGNVSFNSNRANLASTGSLSINLSSLLTIGNEYNFFYKSSSLYEQQGIGIEIDGIPTNIAYKSKDVLYNFPLQYGNTSQSNSSYEISIPTLGAYVEQQTRTNDVDGWGTLTTPFGTFPVLRVVTQLTASDSFYVDTLHAGFNIPLPTQRQYKWIGNGQKEPLLQINTQVILGIETVSSIVYRDSVRNPPVVITSGIDQAPVTDISFNVYPNPACNHFLISYTNQEETQLTVTDITGKELLHKAFEGQTETIDASTWSKGIYLVMLTGNNQTNVKKIVLE